MITMMVMMMVMMIIVTEGLLRDDT